MRLRLFLLNSFLILAGYTIADQPPHWYNLETLSKSEKIKLISALKSEFEYLANYSGWEEEQIANFHFIDLDADKDLDLIFDGWSGGEPECVRVFINKKNKYVKVFDDYQYITNLVIAENVITDLSLIDPGCCASVVTFNKVYKISSQKDSLNFQLQSQKAFIHNTVFPKNKFKRAIDFRVLNKRYHMHLAPFIDSNNVEHEGREGLSNIIATYGEGATGIAVASTTDATGREWWFVEMSPNSKPLTSLFYGYEESPVYLTGWMSVRYLKRI